LWVFNFLQIGTQTEIANLVGRRDHAGAAEVGALALLLSGLFGGGLALVLVPAAPWIARGMGAQGTVVGDAALYLSIRAAGAPAVLMTVAAFGALRGAQAMGVPVVVAVVVNLLNVVLGAALIFGVGPIRPLGVAGAALAASGSQWVGAIWAVVAMLRRLGRPSRMRLSSAGKLLAVGGDLFVRTGLLNAFVLLATRLATGIGAEAGAAHQGIRQVWIFTAFVLDAFAIVGQSLVGFFLGAGLLAQARRAARLACAWSLGAGLVLSAAMLVAGGALAAGLVPAAARGLFAAPWLVAALAQPLNALAFATDGIHWGAGDYRYLRNAMLVATVVGAVALALVDRAAPGALVQIWLATGLWIFVRAVLGVARIWPGIGRAPLAAPRPLA
jgi:multidrug resistance protein, MATE family